MIGGVRLFRDKYAAFTRKEFQKMNGEENDLQVTAERHRFKGVPVFTVIILILIALASCAALKEGPYGGWLVFVAAAGLVAYLDFLTDSRLVYIIPFAAVILSYVIFHPAFSVWTFAVVPSAFFTAEAARGRINKNTALICSAAFILAFAGLHFVLQAALGGDFSVRGVINEILLPYREMKEIFEENSQSIAEAGINLDSGAIKMLKDELIKIMPAAVVCCGLVIAWLSMGLASCLSKFFSYDGVPFGCGIQMSLISAYVFAAAYLITLLFGSLYGNTAIIVTAENISIMLMPGFFVCGLWTSAGNIKRKTGGGMPFVIYCAAVLFLMTVSFGTFSVIFVFYGVIHTFYKRYSRKKGDV